MQDKPPRATSPTTPRPLYIGSDVFRRAAFGANHPLNIVRHSAVLDLVRILGWLPGDVPTDDTREGFRCSRIMWKLRIVWK